MQSKVTLQYPSSLHTHGMVFHKGVETPVSYEIARALKNNPRFQVAGLNSQAAVDAEALASKPRGEDLLREIRASIATFEDVDQNYDRAGKPCFRLLSNVLGYPVSPAERDAALEAPAEPVAPAKSGGVKIVKKPLAEPATPPQRTIEV